MDNYSKFLESLSLDATGLGRQLMSLSAFFNILAASVVGFLVLGVYIASSGMERRDRNLYTVIPLLSVLMAVMMRIDGPQAISFFGIFGIMSVIRFRSDITDQKGITFILFAVIEGVIVGVNAYILALLAWLVVSGAILAGRYLFNRRVAYKLAVGSSSPFPEKLREELTDWFQKREVLAVFSGFRMSSERARKSGAWKERYRAEFTLFPKSDEAFISLVPAFSDWMRVREMTAESRRRD